MALSIEDKKKIVSDVNELANNASSLVLADARGLKVSEANELRSQGHKSNVKFRVAKNKSQLKQSLGEYQPQIDYN